MENQKYHSELDSIDIAIVNCHKFDGTKIEPLALKSHERITEFMSDQITKAVLFTGSKIPETDQSLITQEIIKDIHGSFRMLNEGEVEVAFSKGLREEFGEYYGINIRDMFKWLKEIKSRRQRAISKQAQHLNKNSPDIKQLPVHEKTPGEESEEWYNALMAVIEETGVVPSVYPYDKIHMHLVSNKKLKSEAHLQDNNVEDAKEELADQVSERRQQDINFDVSAFVTEYKSGLKHDNLLKYTICKNYIKRKYEKFNGR